MIRPLIILLVLLMPALGGCALVRSLQDPPEEQSANPDPEPTPEPDPEPTMDPDPEPCDDPQNDCGGCGALTGAVGDICGPCGEGRLACQGLETLGCEGGRGPGDLNACGGCSILDNTLIDVPCGTCDTGAVGCLGEDQLGCVGDQGAGAFNGCGGCAPLGAEPGAACGECGIDVFECVGPDAIECEGDTPCPVGFVRVEAGSFTMGSPLGEGGRFEDEQAHTVVLTRPFLIESNEVTQSDWDDFIGGAPSSHGNCGICPVEQVSFYDALAYANARSLAEGLDPCYTDPGGQPYDEADADSGAAPRWLLGPDCEGWRLPTEAEWEYAARAGTQTAFHNGDIQAVGDACEPDGTLDEVGWYCDNANDLSVAVATRAPNAWGLYDMHGNVAEWVWDWLGDYPPGDAQDPIGPGAGRLKVARGGNYTRSSRLCRAAARDAFDPSAREPVVGFRIVRSLP